MKRLVVLALLSVLLTGCVKQSDYDSLSQDYESLQLKYDELNEEYQSEKERPDWVDLFNKSYPFDTGSIETKIRLSNEGKTALSVTLTDLSTNNTDTYYEDLITFSAAYFNALYSDSDIDNYFYSSYMDNRDDYLSIFGLTAIDHSSLTMNANNRDLSLTYGEKPDWFSETATDFSYMEWLMPIFEQYKIDSQYCFDFLKEYKQ